MEIKWAKGEFHKFKANIKIKIGYIKDVTEIQKDDVFVFDGVFCKYKDKTFKQPSLRGGINQNWVTLMDEPEVKVHWKEKRHDNHAMTLFFNDESWNDIVTLVEKLGVKRHPMIRLAISYGLDRIKSMKAADVPLAIESRK
jgi:hypothetical protein